jgi:hypothetical protein
LAIRRGLHHHDRCRYPSCQGRECEEALAEDTKMEDDSEEAEDPVPQITPISFYSELAHCFFREHFEEAMKFARCSVSNQDIRLYEMFSKVCHGLF